jgi:hypothetical protein
VLGNLTVSGTSTQVAVNGNIENAYSGNIGNLHVTGGTVTVSGTVAGITIHTGGTLNGASPATTYTATLNIQLDGVPYTGAGDYQLRHYDSETITINMTGSGATRTANAPNGIWKVYVSEGAYTDVYTGAVIVISNAPASATLNFYTINYTITDNGAASGSTVSLTLDGFNVGDPGSGNIFAPAGMTASFTVAGAGASSYTYAWSGTVGASSVSGTNATLTISNVTGTIDVTCTVTGSGAAIANFSISNSATQYETLAQAAATVADGGTITMLQDVTASDDSEVELNKTKTYTINLNEKTLGSGGTYSIRVNAGTVTVKNGNVTKGIRVGGGELTVESGMYSGGGEAYSGGEDAIYCLGGKATIISGTFFCTIDLAANGCLVESGGQILIAGGSTVSPPINWKNSGSVTSVTVTAAATSAPIITTTTLPSGTVGATYSQALAATGTTPITWDVIVGALPAGLTLSAAGVISGTPSTAGTTNFTVQASNGTSPDATQALSITVNHTNGIVEVLESSIAIYPNPAKDMLIIENAESRIVNIAIYDISGRTVGADLRVSPQNQGAHTGAPQQINISHLPAGVYLVKAGNKTAKFVKE